MKKMLLLCGALMAFTATMACAQPNGTLNLGWDVCAREGGSNLRTSPCNLNSNTKATNINALVASFVLDGDLPSFNSAEAFINIATSGPIPAWWGAGNCGGKGGNSMIGLVAASPCLNDAFNGNTAPSIVGYVPGTVWNGLYQGATKFGTNPNSAYMDVVSALTVGFETALTHGVEYWAFTINISNSNTFAPAAPVCAGCSTPACLNFKELIVTEPNAVLATPIEITNGDVQPIAYWQNDVTGAAACAGAVPARNATWGSIKSLYR